MVVAETQEDVECGNPLRLRRAAVRFHVDDVAGCPVRTCCSLPHCNAPVATPGRATLIDLDALGVADTVLGVDPQLAQMHTDQMRDANADFSRFVEKHYADWIAGDDAQIVAWATGYLDYVVAEDVDPGWQTPDNALGAATGRPSAATTAAMAGCALQRRATVGNPDRTRSGILLRPTAMTSSTRET
mgnify:CR=1 FL=1